jgi:carboxypeptidase T
MKTRRRAVLAILALVGLTAPQVTVGAKQRAEEEPMYRVRIEAADPSSLVESLERSGYDVIGSDGAYTIDLAVSRDQWLTLRREGFAIVSVERARPLQDALAVRSGARTTDTMQALAALTPANYRDLDGILARLQEIADAHPAIAQVVDLTATYNTPATAEGRHIFALKLSDNVSLDEDEPAMLIASTHHAREIVTPVIALDAAERLTSGYDTDPRIATAVDSHEIWIAPVWNPDGYTYVFTTNNLWRKNRRVFTTGVGVDQNRNYPQGWSSSCAGSTSVTSETYKGPSAGSEAETQTMMTWSETERFAKVLDYHSSGREVLYGYRCLSHPFTTWMRQEAVALSQASGYAGHTRLPSAEGEHPQWQMARLGSYAFLIETHTEFQPSYESALNEAAMVWPGILTVLERPISVSGHVTDAVTGLPLSARIDILNVTFPNGETNSSGGQFGSYHMFLPAGTYDVRFSRNGYAPVVQRVVVGTATSTALDVQLSPSTTVFADDFESNTGWTRNPFGTDTATAGLWERGDPQSTSSNGLKQLGTTVNGVNDLVTGRLSGSSSGVYDLDGGRSSMQSPAIALPSSGSLTLSFSYYLAHGSNSSSADYLRVSIVGATTTTVFQELGDANDDDAAWAVATVNLSAFAGQTVRILVEAADAAGASLVEAAIDDVKIERQ